ncbi:MAG: hypothetical protein R3233_09770 [Xanthomonadales bacterium]|nr:hypothetical protein [Xanthomonadales bacterium]
MTRVSIFLAALAAVVLAGCATSGTSDHGYVSAIPNDRPSQNIFRVNINQVDGKLASAGPNHRVDPGTHTISVSLIFNPAWGQGMQRTQDEIYYQDLEIDIEPGVTYWIGAKVDTKASAEAQRDGSFWEAMVVEQR